MLDGKPQYVDLAGNVALVSKSGDQPSVLFHAFRENRLPFIVRVRDATHDASGRLSFMPESRAARPPAASDLVITATCTLNITLPDYVPGAGTHLDDDELADMHKAYILAGSRPGNLMCSYSLHLFTFEPFLATSLCYSEAYLETVEFIVYHQCAKSRQNAWVAYDFRIRRDVN